MQSVPARRSLLVLFITMLNLTLSSCGVKGPPLPPISTIPQQGEQGELRDEKEPGDDFSNPRPSRSPTASSVPSETPALRPGFTHASATAEKLSFSDAALKSVNGDEGARSVITRVFGIH